jgi:hypothetical protein
LNGKDIIDVTHETPGPRIGWMLHALLEEVLDDPTKNTASYLQDRARSLSNEDSTTLERLGTKGRERKEQEDSREISLLRKKNNVY